MEVLMRIGKSVMGFDKDHASYAIMFASHEPCLIDRAMLTALIVHVADSRYCGSIKLRLDCVRVDEAVCETLENLRVTRRVFVTLYGQFKINAAVFERFFQDAASGVTINRADYTLMTKLSALKTPFKTITLERPLVQSRRDAHFTDLRKVALIVAESTAIREIDLPAQNPDDLMFDLVDLLIRACERSGCIVRLERSWGNDNEAVDYFYRLVRIMTKKRKVLLLHESLLRDRPRRLPIAAFLNRDGDHALGWRVTRFLVGDGR